MCVFRVALVGFITVVIGGTVCGCQAQPNQGLEVVRGIAGEYGIHVGAGARTLNEMAVELARQTQAGEGGTVGAKALLVKMRGEVQGRIELGAENLAHAQVVGYRRVMLLPLRGAGDERIRRDMSRGIAIRTDRSLDLLISGEGFFKVYNENTKETAYVRAGTMEVDSDGRLIARESWRVESPLTFPKGVREVTVALDGRVLGVVPGDNGVVEYGQIQLAVFGDATRLETENGTLYRPTKASGEGRMCNPGTEGTGVLQQGYLEQSNVDLDTEMVTLVRLAQWADVVERAMLLVNGEAGRGVHTRAR